MKPDRVQRAIKGINDLLDAAEETETRITAHASSRVLRWWDRRKWRKFRGI
jgi:hypothetical protein